MRSFDIFGMARTADRPASGAGNRPDMLRRQAIGENALLLVAAAILGFVPAIYALVTGATLPFVLAVLVLAGGLVAMAMERRGLADIAGAAQVATLIATGLVLTLADPRLADAGMAMTLMGPVLAALISSRAIRRASWLALAPVILAGAAMAFAGVPSESAWVMPASAAGFGLAFIIVARTAHRINAGFEVHDKAQISAYRHLVEHIQDAVLRFGSDGAVLLASRSSETLFGCPRYQISGEALSERLHIMDRPLFLTAFADANQGGRSRTVEVRLRQDDPRARTAIPRFVWVEMQLSPVLDETAVSGRHEVIGLLRDITARKDAESAMAEARRAAEEASHAKSRFLATIGHELRTPLNAVVGFSEMMSSGIAGDLSPTQKEYSGLIHQSGKHLLEVVGMLLDMSRIEAGKFEISAEPLAAAEIVPACFSMVEKMAQDRKVTLVSEVEPDLPFLTADERVCRQILINLLTNAVKFSHESGVVTLSVRRQGQSINFSVRDRGIGMAPAALSRIGEPFFQAQDGLSRKYEGTGLGLSIVKGLVELHGGTLRAVSEIGAGTTFTVLLPINGPATKPGDTAEILPLYREPAVSVSASWPNEKRKAQ